MPSLLVSQAVEKRLLSLPQPAPEGLETRHSSGLPFGAFNRLAESPTIIEGIIEMLYA